MSEPIYFTEAQLVAAALDCAMGEARSKYPGLVNLCTICRFYVPEERQGAMSELLEVVAAELGIDGRMRDGIDLLSNEAAAFMSDYVALRVTGNA